MTPGMIFKLADVTTTGAYEAAKAGVCEVVGAGVRGVAGDVDGA